MSADTANDEERPKAPGRAWLLGGLLVAVAGFAILSVAGSGDGVSEAASDAQADSIPYVETAPVEAAGKSYEVHAPGLLRARDTLTLVGEVSGKVTQISPNLKIGGRIVQGETVLKIDDGDFLADLARANAQVSTANARLEQARAERERQLRLTELGASPTKSAEQAVAAFEDAQAAVQQSEAQRAVARRTLAKSEIKAPFDAIVTNENVSLGTFVSPGQSLGTLISAGTGEIRAGLPAEDVNAVRAAMAASEDGQVRVRAVPNSSSLSSQPLEGYLADFSPAIDQSSRTATVIAIFPDAFTLQNEGTVFADDFMDIEISGVSDAPIWRIPEGAIRQDSYVWVIGEDDRLRRVAIEPLDRVENAILVHSEALDGSERVMITVLAEEIDGMPVHVSEPAP